MHLFVERLRQSLEITFEEKRSFANVAVLFKKTVTLYLKGFSNNPSSIQHHEQIEIKHHHRQMEIPCKTSFCTHLPDINFAILIVVVRLHEARLQLLQHRVGDCLWANVGGISAGDELPQESIKFSSLDVAVACLRLKIVSYSVTSVHSAFTLWHVSKCVRL